MSAIVRQSNLFAAEDFVKDWEDCDGPVIRRGPGLGRVEFYNDNIGGPGVGISSPWFRIPRFASPPLPGRCTNGEKSKNEPQASYRPKNLTI